MGFNGIIYDLMGCSAPTSGDLMATNQTIDDTLSGKLTVCELVFFFLNSNINYQRPSFDSYVKLPEGM